MTWKEDLREVFNEKNFEIILADLFAFPATILADELKIPNLISFPGPLDVLNYFKIHFP